MAPLPPVASVVKCNLNWQIDNNLTAESILYFSYTGSAPSTSACIAIAATVQGAAVTDMKALLNSSNFIGQATILDLATSSGASGAGGTATVGTRSGAGNVASACMVFNHAIARRYRGGKPRTYAPFGVDGDLSTGGVWTTGFQTSCSSSFSNFITNALTASSGGCSLSEHVNVSYYHAKALRATPVVDVITATTPRARIGSQRRRMRTA